jgi:eukaryotic-like serine/threonine-protein kinase
MPAPVTVDEFLDLIRKSGVVEESRLSGYMQQIVPNSSKSSDPKHLAGYLVRDGLLTYFQAEQFLQGKWKRFTIGKYKVLERLGSGGMGQVFLCEHKLMRRRVAVKVLPTAKAEDPSSLERFYREARAVASLDHPNIVRAYDIDQDDNLHFLVMEYVDGASLQDIVKKFGAMDVLRACHYIYWSAVGLQHAHENGLIHRDIKPGNILVDRTGVVKILDLGLARFFHDDDDLLTKKYDESVLGTADYLAPEQAIDSHGVDGRADIYSLGATFYFLLTGNPPYVEGTVAQKLIWHQSRDPRPVREYRPEVPEGVVTILAKMMAKRPQDRYQTPAEVAAALSPWVQTPIPPPPEREMPQLCAAVIAAGATTGGGTMTSGTRPLPGAFTAPPAPPPPAAPATAPKRSGPSSVNLLLPPPPANAETATASPSTGAASVAAQKTTRRREPTPVVEPIPGPPPLPEHRVWESITAEAGATVRADAERRQGSSVRKKRVAPASSRAVRPGPVDAGTPPSKKRLYLYAGIGAGVVLAAALLAWKFLGKSDKAEGAGRYLTVSAHQPPGENRYRTVKEAVEYAKPHDHIIILDDVWEETVVLSKPPSDLVIEPGEGRHVVWRLPSGQRAKPKGVLEISNAEGLRLRGFTFEAQNEADSALRLSGRCPGATFEDLTLTEAHSTALKFINCAGEEGRPIVVQRCRIASTGAVPADVAVGFTALSGAKVGSPRSQFIQVRDCRIEGPFKIAAFEFEGPADNIEVAQNRIWNVANGVYLKKPATSDQSMRLTLTGNTFHTISKAALHFEAAGALPSGKNLVELAQNYFYDAGTLVYADDKAAPAILAAKDNARGGKTNEGNPSLHARQVDVPLPSNPADDHHFLRYSRNSPLATAANGSPIGAPPGD